MWLLIIIVMKGATTAETTLEQYTTERLCNIEKVRVELNMHRAYPKDHNYRLICRYQDKVA